VEAKLHVITDYSAVSSVDKFSYIGMLHKKGNFSGEAHVRSQGR